MGAGSKESVLPCTEKYGFHRASGYIPYYIRVYIYIAI